MTPLYSVKLPTAFDLKKAWGLDAVEELVKISKSDIENRNWERYVEAYLSNLRKTEESKRVKSTLDSWTK